MVGSISSNSSYALDQVKNSTSDTSNSLSTSQKDTISSVLSQFDSSNLSASDAKSIIQSFQDAGIEPSADLATAMEAEGFDAKEVGDLGGAPRGAGGMPPPPPPSQEELHHF